MNRGPIGIFDSGFGGLTVFRAISEDFPNHDFVYLGDNARSPYGTRSFETVYEYTLQAVSWFFKQGCPLVILACNTASAKALRNIQQLNLPVMAPHNRVLGVIRPTAEKIGLYSKTGHVGIMATRGTIISRSYPLEIGKFFPEVRVFQQACPLLVPLIENNEHESPGASYFIEKYTRGLLNLSAEIDTVLLGCTHYPVIETQIKQWAGEHVRIISQGEIISDSLADYLGRHPEIHERIAQHGDRRFYTSDDPVDFENHAPLFFGQPVKAEQVKI